MIVAQGEARVDDTELGAQRSDNHRAIWLGRIHHSQRNITGTDLQYLWILKTYHVLQVKIFTLSRFKKPFTHLSLQRDKSKSS
jgi:hypothetical protein